MASQTEVEDYNRGDFFFFKRHNLPNESFGMTDIQRKEETEKKKKKEIKALSRRREPLHFCPLTLLMCHISA